MSPAKLPMLDAVREIGWPVAALMTSPCTVAILLAGVDWAGSWAAGWAGGNRTVQAAATIQTRRMRRRQISGGRDFRHAR